MWKRWWVIAIAVVVVLAIIGAVFGGGSDDDGDDSRGVDTSANTGEEVADTTDDGAESGTTQPAATEARTSEAPETTAVESTEAEPAVVESTDAEATVAQGGDEASLTIESGFSTTVNSIGSQQTSSGAVVTNGSDESACGVQVQFNLLDAAGATIDTATETIDFLAAGARGVVAPTILGFEAGVPASLNVSIIQVDDFVDGADIDDCGGFTILEGIPIEVVSPTITRDQFFASIEGQLTNGGGELAETTFIDCVYRAAGMIVGGESTASLDPIPPGQTVAFSAGLGFIPDNADTVECQANA